MFGDLNRWWRRKNKYLGFFNSNYCSILKTSSTTGTEIGRKSFDMIRMRALLQGFAFVTRLATTFFCVFPRREVMRFLRHNQLKKEVFRCYYRSDITGIRIRLLSLRMYRSFRGYNCTKSANNNCIVIIKPNSIMPKKCNF